LLHLYGQKKKAARRAVDVDKARINKAEEVHTKLEKEDSGRKMIYKLASDRDEDGKDMKGSGD